MTEEAKTETETTETQVKPETEANGAAEAKTDEIDLDKELGEFTKPAEGSTQQQTTTAKPSEDKTAAEIAAIKAQLEQRQFAEDQSRLLKTVRGDFTDDEFDDDTLWAWIEGRARKEPKLQQAWDNQHKDPKGFQRIALGLAQEFAKKHAHVRRVDPNATADAEAVTDAVRGQSNKKAPEGKAPNFGSMTDAEKREYTEKNFGYTPAA